jgi:hypothetical protein
MQKSLSYKTQRNLEQLMGLISRLKTSHHHSLTKKHQLSGFDFKVKNISSSQPHKKKHSAPQLAHEFQKYTS